LSDGKVYELSQLVTRLENEGGYFMDFLKTRNLEAGIIVLHPNEADTQEPHSDDELYYVISGNAWMEMGKKKIEVKEGSIIFIPAGLRHRFYGNSKDLFVLYVFAAKE
jgi:mannose-6-phosphate isomerase-like protein (cupin superfamily)